MGSGAPRCGPLFILLGSVDSDGMGKQNPGEAMWLLHSHAALAYWIRLMSVQEGGLLLPHPTLTEVDGLGLCLDPCCPEGCRDQGRSGTEGRSGLEGSPIPGSATC